MNPLCQLFNNPSPPISVSPEILADARVHGMEPLLYDYCKSSLAAHRDVDVLRRATAIWEATSLFRNQAISELTAEADTCNLPILLMKGAALGYQIYPSPGMRPCMDVDILIDEVQIEEVKQLLHRLGYGLDQEEPSLISYQFIATKDLDGGQSVVLDVHYRVNNQLGFARLFSFEELYQRAEPIPDVGPHACALGIADAFMLACIHRNGHLAQGEPERLIWLYDIYLMLKQMDAGTVQTISELVESKRLHEVCQAGVTAAIGCFHINVPEILKTLLASHSTIENGVTNLATNPVSVLWDQFRFQQTWPLRLRFLRELFFPSAKKMRFKYPDSRLPLPVLYLRRALSGFLRRSKNS